MLSVYGKLKSEKRFKGFDMKNNVFVANKINLSLFHESEKEALQKEVDYMNKHNKDYIFEIRKVN